ncbi:hypothetical protein CTAYLR_007614 [Chrysophaeum taylorii]|uniref:Methyltransferase small domain-containing protein n=1 Tax=Chrysophaeum taylorii TaxID=2483200 RepID=A0AAD7U6C5_9STRA|nr:hypothetical protein CTAYLR_007614 [Chrysophaeum taylorii]
MPATRLVPCIPNRLAYLCWLREIVGPGPKRVLDVGTGCSAIYAILGHACFGWSFVATDVDDEALEWARRNARGLPIEVRRCDGVPPGEEHFDLVLSNPPFFENEESDDRRGESCAACESRTIGSEVEFVKRLVDPDAREWRSAMLGVKAHLKPVLAALKNFDRATTTLVVGNVARWGVAWRRRTLKRSFQCVAKEEDDIGRRVGVFFEERHFVKVSGGGLPLIFRGPPGLVEVGIEEAVVTFATHPASGAGAAAFAALADAAPGEAA